MYQPIYILGPCSAETEEQTLMTADQIAHEMARCASCGTLIYRAGIWKPRTQPDSFQGIGVEGLSWLARVTERTGMPTATEVATPEQVREAATHAIPYIWIGARTAANPIAVQEIADAIKETGGSFEAVLVKNPVNPDAALWIGDIERVEQAGMRVVAVHRGCSHRPCWQMAYTLHQNRRDIPLLLDPSHLCGDAALVPALCDRAVELGYDGLMIEVHCAPGQAWSDSRQQITPEAAGKVIGQGPSSVPPSKGGRINREAEDLLWLRAMIDETDDVLWETIEERMAISRRIGVWKKEQGVDIVQPARFQTILEQRQRWGATHGINEETIRHIMEAIHTESVRQQA